MMDLASINNKHVVLQDTMLLKEYIVLSVMLLNTGMLSLKDVLLANLDILGIMLLTNVHAANFQEQLLVMIVFVQHQKQSGTMMLKHVLALLIALETIVSHAQLQDNGTSKTILAFALHQ
jgi:hypothetical protein